ncbi:MAG: YdcF family protein [Aestuariibacter sp.]
MTVKDNSAIVVLGHKNSSAGQLSDIAQARCKVAFQLYQKTQLKLICTGAFGDKFNNTSRSHAQHLQAYLHQLGVPTAKFLASTMSHNTYEDGKLTAKIIEQHLISHIHLVTSDFHLQRAFLWFKLFNGELKITPCSATTIATETQLQQLHGHEKQALINFYRDFPDFPDVASFQDWQISLPAS